MDTDGRVIKVPHIVRGRAIFGSEVEHRSRVGETFVTPKLDLDALVLSRGEPGPAFDVEVTTSTSPPSPAASDAAPICSRAF